LSGNWIRSIYQDRSGIIWIGTVEAGISKFNPDQKKFSHHRSIPGRDDSLGSNLVYSFLESPPGILWIGTLDGLERLDRETNAYDHFRADPGMPGTLSHNIIRCIHADRQGTLWLGTDGGGLARFDRQSGRVTAFLNDPLEPGSLSCNRVRTVLEDRAGNFWIGTFGGGLELMDRRQHSTFSHHRFDPGDPGSLGNNVVLALLEAHDGTLWIGTYGGGLNRLDRETGKFTRFRNDAGDRSSLSNDYVLCVHEDSTGNIWAGTWGGGLSKLDREKGTFSHFTTSDGLASDKILGILEDAAGNLWLTTYEGLSRFSPRTRQCRNYEASDGLQGNKFNNGAQYKNRNGEMFVGGANGFNVFDPLSIFDNTYVPPVRITSFKVLNREVKMPRPVWETGEIVLQHQDTLFSLEFAALDYTAPEKNRYAYKLEGLTEDWIHTDSRRRMASFSRLPAGNYVFKVRGSNSDGLWNEQETSLVIRVRGPWWKSWWFLLLLTGAVLLISYELSRTRIRRLAARIRTEEAMEQFFGKCAISPREREIVMLLLKGLSNKEIGEKLYIELSTVKIHVHHILKKLGVGNRTQLVRLFQNMKVQ
jgi:ligand-binding sensor domain-containing protein/DNA-binding CsgD family transcriptional regulator